MSVEFLIFMARKLTFVCKHLSHLNQRRCFGSATQADLNLLRLSWTFVKRQTKVVNKLGKWNIPYSLLLIRRRWKQPQNNDTAKRCRNRPLREYTAFSSFSFFLKRHTWGEMRCNASSTQIWFDALQYYRLTKQNVDTLELKRLVGRVNKGRLVDVT